MQTLITAHTGADDTPDNSIAYLEYALRSGADVVEIDVRCTSDNELILTHDEITTDAADKAFTPVPLEEAFQMLQAHPSARMNIDLKEDGLEADVYALARKMQIADRILYSGSVSIDRLRAADLLGVVEICLNIEEILPDLKAQLKKMEEEGAPLLFPLAERIALADRACEICTTAGLDTLNVCKDYMDAPLIEHIHAKGVALSVWTVDDEEEATFFLRQGVKSITTRKLAALLSLRDSLA